MTILSVRSNFFNALIPGFLKHLVMNTLLFLLVYWLFSVIAGFYAITDTRIILYWGLFFVVIVSLLMMTREFVRVYFSWFTFYDDRVQASYKFLSEHSHTINYHHITDVKIKKNVWDRICRVGDVIIYTSKNSSEGSPSHFIIADVDHPERLKDKILQKIARATNHQYSSNHQHKH